VTAAETVDLAGLKDAVRRAAAPPADYGPLLKRVAVALRADALKNFAGSHDPDGNAWAPLKPSTLKGRRKGGKGAKPLIDTGLLRNSVTTVRQGPLELLFGTNLPRGAYHQFGTRTIPARPFLGISPRLADLIAEMTADYVVAQMRG
jgi:phage virion morphogenesis protein